MDFKADSLSEAARFYFFKIFYDVQPGEHQYKFRVGPGDGGWAIDDDMDKGKPKVSVDHVLTRHKIWRR